MTVATAISLKAPATVTQVLKAYIDDNPGKPVLVVKPFWILLQQEMTEARNCLGGSGD